MTPLDILDLRDAPNFTNARCAEPFMDPEWWQPHPSSTGTYVKAICRRCEHETACLTWALEHPDVEGIWGATTHHERLALLKQGRAS